MSKSENKGFLEKWAAKAVALTAILTLLFLLFPDLKPTPTETPLRSTSTQTPTSNPGDIILGIWEQFIFVSETDLRSGGKFLVSRAEGEYVMSSVSQPDDARSIHSIEISQIQSDGNLWTFTSNQGAGRIVYFELKKVSENVFEGCAQLDTTIIQCDRWIRIVGP